MVSAAQGRVRQELAASKRGQRVFVGFVIALLLAFGVAALAIVFTR